MKIAILTREETMQRCTGKGCLNAFFQKKDAFAHYLDREVTLSVFTHAGGDLDHKIAMMLKNDVQVVHLSSCLRSKSPDYEAIATRLSEYFDVIGYTHGPEEGKEQPTFIAVKAR
jgi:predicted metal-binding protein